MRKTAYYIDGISTERLDKIISSVAENILNGNDEYTLENGTTLLIYNTSHGDYRIYDEDLNLVAEYINQGLGTRKHLYQMALDLMRWARA